MEQAARLGLLQSLLEEDLEWDFLMDAGLHNETLPLLYWHLNQACPERVSASITRRMCAFFSRTTVRS